MPFEPPGKVTAYFDYHIEFSAVLSSIFVQNNRARTDFAVRAL